ncbi:MAG: DsbA family protein [Alkalilacustris sp.]
MPHLLARLRSAAAPLIAAAALAVPASALDLEALSDAERAAFRAEVRAYLLENPELLLEVIAVLEDQQAAAQGAGEAALIAAHAEALFDNPNSWVGGNPEGDVTVVEFVDYNCGFCRRALPEVMGMVEADPGVRLVMKEFPILGADSEEASRFAIAVLQLEGDAAYKEVHSRMLTMEGRAAGPALTRLAEDLGLDMAAISDRMQAPEVSAVIDANRALAQALGINGTPTFVIEDRMVRGFLPAEGMLELVEAVRAEG